MDTVQTSNAIFLPRIRDRVANVVKYSNFSVRLNTPVRGTTHVLTAQ